MNFTRGRDSDFQPIWRNVAPTPWAKLGRSHSLPSHHCAVSLGHWLLGSSDLLVDFHLTQKWYHIFMLFAFKYQKIVKRRDHFSGYWCIWNFLSGTKIRHNLLYLPVGFFKLKSRLVAIFHHGGKGCSVSSDASAGKKPGSTYPSGQP